MPQRGDPRAPDSQMVWLFLGAARNQAGSWISLKIHLVRCFTERDADEMRGWAGGKRLFLDAPRINIGGKMLKTLENFSLNFCVPRPIYLYCTQRNNSDIYP